MRSVLHVIDDACDETQLQVLETLRARLTADGERHTICSLDMTARRRAALHIKDKVVLTRRIFPSRYAAYSSALGRIARKVNATIIHAWSVGAAAVCSAMFRDEPLLLTLLDPQATGDTARWVRSFPSAATIVAGSQLISNRLVTAGLPSERVVVIRDAADFGALNKARRDGTRERVVGDRKPVVLIGGPPTRTGGQEQAVWAAGIIHFLHSNLCVLMPYDTRESRRIVRWVRSMGLSDLLIVPDPRLTWPELVACADVFLQPATDEVCTEPISVAMAAGIPIVASARRSIAELIADRHNGLLVKNSEPKLVAARLLTAIEDKDLVRTVTDLARGQAFEVFGVRAFVDNYRRVYANITEGRPAGDGVRDTAMTG